MWQELYQELGGQGFVPIAVALDQCADDPRPYIEKAAATHPSLIDTEHVVSHRYGMINVPSPPPKRRCTILHTDPTFTRIDYKSGFPQPG